LLLNIGWHILGRTIHPSLSLETAQTTVTNTPLSPKKIIDPGK
jgi:hypothetical protein